MHFFAFLWLTVAMFPVILGAVDSRSILNQEKRETLELERRQNVEESQKLKWQWLNPLTLSYSESNNFDYSPSAYTRSYRVGVNQPIFKSGAIYYGIRYAGSSKRYGDVQMDIKEKSLIRSALVALFNMRRVDFQIQKQGLLVKNADLEVQRKQEQFKAGFIDGSELDNAILSQNQAKLSLLDLEESRQESLSALRTVSDVDYTIFELPKFFWIERDSYLTKNLELERLRLDEQRQRDKYRGVAGSFGPQISLQADYYRQKVERSPAVLRGDWNEYTTAGVTLSIPFFNVTRSHQVESARIDHLKAALSQADALRSEEVFYEKQKFKLQSLQERRRIASENLTLYTSLLSDNVKRKRIGEVTAYDVEIMQNSKEIRELDLKIYDLDEQLILLELYIKTQS